MMYGSSDYEKDADELFPIIPEDTGREVKLSLLANAISG